MTTELEKLNQNYEQLRAECGLMDTRFYIGEISDSTPEQFAKEANLVMEAYMGNNTTVVEFNDSYANR